MPKGEKSKDTPHDTKGYSRKEPVVVETDKDASQQEVAQSLLNMIYGANQYFANKGLGSVSDAKIIHELSESFVQVSKCLKDDKVTRVLDTPPPIPSKSLAEVKADLAK